MRLRIAATIAHRHAGEVSQVHLQARLSPAATARQVVLAHPLSSEPTGWQRSHDDYWGTRVVELEVTEAHERFQLSLLSDVNLTGIVTAAPATDFARLDAAGVEDSFTEFLRPTALTTASDADARVAVRLRQETPNPTALAEALSRELAPGPDAGVDDATHRVIGALRAGGVPARFVSGYRAPVADFEPGASAAGEIASWLDVWDGTWQGFDPARVSPIGDRHVIIGWGRDRADVPPLRGIYCGPEGAACVTEVQVTRLA